MELKKQPFLDSTKYFITHAEKNGVNIIWISGNDTPGGFIFIPFLYVSKNDGLINYITNINTVDDLLSHPIVLETFTSEEILECYADIISNSIWRNMNFDDFIAFCWAYARAYEKEFRGGMVIIHLDSMGFGSYCRISSIDKMSDTIYVLIAGNSDRNENPKPIYETPEEDLDKIMSGLCVTSARKIDSNRRIGKEYLDEAQLIDDHLSHYIIANGIKLWGK